MALKRQLTEDMKTAMRGGDKPRLGVIRLMLAAIKQREVDERIELDDSQVLAVLEKMLSASGSRPVDLWTSPSQWGDLGEELDDWIGKSGRALAYATLAASTVIDFEAAVIDGWMPPDVRRRLVETVRTEIVKLDSEGIRLPEIREGTVGHHARALGGASLPLSDRFLTGPAVSSKAP